MAATKTRKKSQVTERSYDNPDIAWEYPNGGTIKVFVLSETETIATQTSTNYDHKFTGPSLVVEEVFPDSGRSVREKYVNDVATWQWISGLLVDGVSKFAKVTTLKQ